jgi:alkylated DNA repair dioxygenase AlkB
MVFQINQNLLPYDGELYWQKAYYSQNEANVWLHILTNTLAWQKEQLFIYGKWLNVPRLTAWYGDPEAYYRYSGVMHAPSAWTHDLQLIKTNLETSCQHTFNSVLANLYRNEHDSMGSHADNEPELGINPFIASLSFGATRLLRFRHAQNHHRIDIELEHGDLLVMVGSIQKHWRHELPKTRKPKDARINLTFRKILVNSTLK